MKPAMRTSPGVRRRSETLYPVRCPAGRQFDAIGHGIRLEASLYLKSNGTIPASSRNSGSLVRCGTNCNSRPYRAVSLRGLNSYPRVFSSAQLRLTQATGPEAVWNSRRSSTNCGASQLLTEEQIQRALDEFPQAAPPALAGILVARGLLTEYQADQLLRGNASGFVFGPYRILDYLGRGGLACVFRATHTLMDRVVAVKVFGRSSPTANAAAAELVRWEARAWRD